MNHYSHKSSDCQQPVENKHTKIYSLRLEGITDCSLIYSALVGFSQYKTGYRYIPNEGQLEHAYLLRKRLNYPCNAEAKNLSMNRIEASILTEALYRLSCRVSYMQEENATLNMAKRIRAMLNS